MADRFVWRIADNDVSAESMDIARGFAFYGMEPRDSDSLCWSVPRSLMNSVFPVYIGSVNSLDAPKRYKDLIGGTLYGIEFREGSQEHELLLEEIPAEKERAAYDLERQHLLEAQICEAFGLDVKSVFETEIAFKVGEIAKVYFGVFANNKVVDVLERYFNEMSAKPLDL